MSVSGLPPTATARTESHMAGHSLVHATASAHLPFPPTHTIKKPRLLAEAMGDANITGMYAPIIPAIAAPPAPAKSGAVSLAPVGLLAALAAALAAAL